VALAGLRGIDRPDVDHIRRINQQKRYASHL
jgi:hypothetical protein